MHPHGYRVVAAAQVTPQYNVSVQSNCGVVPAGCRGAAFLQVHIANG